MNKREAKRIASQIAAAQVQAFLDADGSWTWLGEDAPLADYARFRSALEELVDELDARGGGIAISPGLAL